MNKKFKSLKKKDLLLSLILILFTAILFYFSVIYQSYTQSTKTIIQCLNDIEKDILRLKSAEQNFLLNFNNISNLYTSGDTQFENEFSFKQNNIITTIDSLSNYIIVQNDLEINEQIQILQENLKYYSDNFLDMALAYKEKGSEMNGIVGEWQSISLQMIEKFSSFTDNPIYIQLLKLKNIEKQYLLSKNPNLINDISILSGEIQNSIVLAVDETVELPNITDELFKYVEKAKQVLNIDNRIGFQLNTGIINSLNNSFKMLNESVSRITLMIDKKITSGKIHLFITLTTITILLLSGLIFILRRSLKRYIFNPLTKISEYLSELTTGKLPDEKIKLRTNDEFSSLADSVNILVDNSKDKAHHTQNLNKGILDSDLNLLSEDDLLGQELILMHKNIQTSADEQIKHNEENTKRRFINEGLAKFSDILRLYNNDIEKLADIFIKELVKYLDAVQGGIFLINAADEKNKTLQLISTFAFNRKKYIDKKILIGEGLVGTCAIEKKTINLTEIPDEYIAITSGLGEAPPNNLLLLPIIQDDEALGVIEIASINNFQKHEIEIGEQVAASLASTVTTTKNNEKTARLLAKSQLQAQEMLEQEEEMRQNMEELKATQEEALRREEEYEGIINAVEQSALVVEYDLDGNVIRINKKFLLFLGKSREDIMGKKHANLTSLGSKTKVNAKFWSDLKKENQMVISETIKIGKTKEFVLIQNFSSVLNKNGVLVKFLNIIIDITSVINNQK